MIQLEAEEVLHIQVECNVTYNVGKNLDGDLNVIAITGGKFSGKINGTVVPGGADWNMAKESSSHLFAKYLLKTEDGFYIAVENEGVLIESDWNNKIKTTPRFIVNNDSPYAWLNSGVYVGSLEPGKEGYTVDIHIYHMK